MDTTTSNMLWLAEDRSLIGRFMEMEERGDVYIGPIKEIVVERDNYVLIKLEWTAVRSDIAHKGAPWHLMYAENPPALGGSEKWARAYLAQDSSIQISIPMIGRGIIHPADFPGIEKPTS